jgi:radical SAM superfamily enzyme YgiQ (UPF0313 family)
MQNASPPRALLIDLNNFARYPTLAIGYLVAGLRSSGLEVDVLSPLSHDVAPTEREPPETRRAHLERRVYFSTHPLMLPLHDAMRAGWSKWNQRPDPRVIEQATAALDAQRPDVVLLSAYLDHHPSVCAIGTLCRSRRVPLILGGPVLNLPEIAREWLSVPGLTALVGGEVDFSLPRILETLFAAGDLAELPGVFLPDGRTGPPAQPLAGLERLPVADFTDFPWEKYPQRVIPIMTGRGCGWGRCLFCGDVVTANGRGFRSRPVDRVLDELEEQSQRHATKNVVFLDIKLNSSLDMWHGLIDGFQDRLPGGRWIGTVHVQARGENGLTADELRAARAAGMERISFGLETGSERVNTSMAKGTKLERTSEFIRDAHAAGLSVRTTTMLGYPGEKAEDVVATTEFVGRHEHALDRISMSRFKVIPGTAFHRQYERHPDRYRDLTHFKWHFGDGRAHYRYKPAAARDYRRAKADLLRLVHRINRKPLRGGADVFTGVM